MDFDEIEVYLTRDGLGRAAIRRRQDGLFCIYTNWILSEDSKKALNVRGGRTSWMDAPPSTAELNNAYLRTGLFAAVEDARRELRGIQGFSEAILTVQ